MTNGRQSVTLCICPVAHIHPNLSHTMPAAEIKEFGARVPLEEYERFRSAFPQYGATNWFINEALRAFNDYVDEHPEVRNAIDNSINSMLDETLSGSQQRAS